MADEKKAAFGVFPQMKPRRSKQDREAAKNVPVDLARGVISGALGIPGDIESLARLPYELITGQESPTILPTSEDIEKRLPFKSDTPVGGVATGLGQIAGGFATPAPAIRAAKKLRQTIGNLPPADPRMSQMGVIKPPGGNWLTGSVEKAIEPLKMRGLTQAQADEMAARPTPIMMAREGVLSKSDEALNQWIDRNLTNYVKKQMATPDDPVRKLAEQGIDPQGRFQYAADKNLPTLEIIREELGFPPKGMGQSPQAQNWEKIADETTLFETAGDIIAIAQNNKLYGDTFQKYKKILEENPWLLKVDPNTPVYSPKAGNWSYGDTGFDHIVDVLRQDLREGRIRPEQLNKVSMEQAVRRTYEYDQEMAKKMREAQIKATEGMPIYKEYPEGYKWVELALPKLDVLPEGSSFQKLPSGMTQVVDSSGSPLTVPASDETHALRLLAKERGYKTLEDALKYEGETMGHCVGGYCPDVMAGRSRIFSLRDAKGEPHVTVEVEPAPRIGFREGEGPKTPEERFDLQTEWLEGLKSGKIGEDVTFANWWRQKNNIPEPELPFQISQIKGKQNRAPKEEYLPFVQDFVKSGQWSKVGDLGNTGLYRADPEELGMLVPEDPRLRNLPGRRTEDFIKAKEAGLFGDQKYFTRQEWEDILRRQIESESGPLPPLEGMKRGGKVRFTDNPDAMRLELQMAAGGLAKGLKAAAKAAKAGSDAPKPIVEAPSIIIPSKIQNVREAVRKREGNYGAKRVERAADEIRNLERMYTEKALIDAFVGDNAKAVVTMSPADFERYAEQLKGRTLADIGPKMSELARQGEIDKYTVPTEEYIQHLMRVQGGFDQVPYLNLYKDEVGLPIKPEVRGHEGRHRSRALTEAGEPSALVEIKPRGDLREGLPRRSQEEFIEALREELRLSDRLVLPQTDGTSRRPAIILPEPYAEGGKVRMAAGGLAKAAKALKAAKEAPIKASEALGRVEGRPLVITQADRTKVGGGYLGGPGFSGLQLTEPEYRAAEAAWGVKTPGVAKMILGGGKAAGKDPVYAAMLGTPTQHQSNQMVFDKLYGDFKKSAKKGNLDPELRDLINTRLASAVDKKGNPVFPPDVDILSKNFKDLANTFDRRAVTANLIGGVTVGGKKGQIIDYDKIIRETTDPLLIEAPTGAVGNRLFTLSGGVIDRPDLHPAFPTILQGEDLGVSFNPVTRDLIMKDFIQQTMREKGRAPGYMDYTRGYPPSQLITEDLLTELQKLGLKKGGKVKITDDPEEMRREMAVGGIVKGLKKAAKASKGTQEILPAAEREANLARFLEPSKVQQRLYHGTMATEGGKGQEAIRSLKPSKEGSLGSGVYMTPSTAQASGYSGSPNAEAIDAMLTSPYQADTALQFLRNQQTGNVLPGQVGGNMLPVYAQLKNPLVIDGSIARDPMVEALMRLGMDKDSAGSMVERAYERKGYIGKEVENRARAAGFDGIMQYRDGELSEVVSYNPSAVKSAIGNIGTYDTRVKDLSKAAGGKVTSPAAQIDGNDFLLAARRHGLSEDIETLNKMVRLVNQGATVDEAARIVSGNAVSKAAGGEISADDLIIEERPL